MYPNASGARSSTVCMHVERSSKACRSVYYYVYYYNGGFHDQPWPTIDIRTSVQYYLYAINNRLHTIVIKVCMSNYELCKKLFSFSIKIIPMRFEEKSSDLGHNKLTHISLQRPQYYPISSVINRTTMWNFKL